MIQLILLYCPMPFLNIFLFIYGLMLLRNISFYYFFSILFLTKFDMTFFPKKGLKVIAWNDFLFLLIMICTVGMIIIF